MGNRLGREKSRKAKIMKTDGHVFKLKLPATATDVLQDYPAGHVLLESESVKNCGIRAPRLRPEEGLKPGKIYFLVEMPRFPEARRVKSFGCAKERLERMMLRQKSGSGPGPVRVKMRLPRAEVEKLMEESKDEVEVAERILDFCLHNSVS